MSLVAARGGASTSTPSTPSSAAFAPACAATAPAHTTKCRTTFSTSPVGSGRSRGRWEGDRGHNKG
jgi:hypothetical protein